ncbi:dehydrogenase [Cryobacterium frigoriphilum]|uniref:Dehydrogenase n=1 Tax=Cryobacterium frigoriphilum TaxID=1259150 RepID=A0A4R9A191_9MICO|nr:dehydrogenase [Cryobacterium frigoriphilum]TFD50244.1 dehydrogenase [Cryobacterium frigoriphilum]
MSPGTELASAFAAEDPARVSYPASLGYGAVFRIDEVGEDVTRHAVGDVVFGTGPHASVQREEQTRVVAVPRGLHPTTAVFARLIAVPLAALVTTAARPGDRVGIVGLGLVGNLAAQAFAASGYAVTAWDPLIERRRAVPAAIRVVAEPVLDDPADVFELIVDCSGHDGAVVRAARVVAKNGELVLTGTPWARRTDASAHELLHLIFHRYLHVRSGWEWQLPFSSEDFRSGSVLGNFGTALRWLDADRIAVTGLASLVSPRDAQEALTALAERRSDTLTYVFDWQNFEA